MRKPIILLLALLIGVGSNLIAQEKLTLEQCHEMARKNNKKQSIEQENLEMAKALRQAAFSNFFPKLSANGAYYYNSENISLYPEQKMSDVRSSLDPATNFSKLMQNPDFQQAMNNWMGQLASYNPQLAQQLQASIQDFASNGIKNVETAFNQKADEIRSKMKDALTFDVQNVFVLQVGVTQPIYVGGRLREMYNIAKANERIAGIKAEHTDADILIDVDEAYWRVLSVENKKKLADQYVALLEQFCQNVEYSVQEGVATQADLLKVRVKLNEAKMSQARADNGLVLSKMALCQLIGLPLTTDVQLDDKDLEEVQLSENDSVNMEGVAEHRQEIKLLEEACKISKSSVRIVAAQLQPNIVATGGYVATNPNLVNGFENKFNGWWHVGVAMNVPIAHPSDIFALKAAKHAANMANLELEEAKEKVELQANQSSQKFNESNKNLIRAKSNLKAADENLRMAQEAYTEGMVTTTDVLGAQTAWLQAHSDEIDAAIDTKLTYLTYLKHTGRLH